MNETSFRGARKQEGAALIVVVLNVFGFIRVRLACFLLRFGGMEVVQVGCGLVWNSFVVCQDFWEGRELLDTDTEPISV